MKKLLKNTAVNALSLFLLSQLLSGVKIEGGFQTFLVAGIVFYIISFIMRPILKLITFPFNLATFGLFSFLINIPVLYVLTLIVPQIKISSFVFQGANLAGFIVPKMSFNTFFAFAVSSIVLSLIISSLKWATEK